MLGYGCDRLREIVFLFLVYMMRKEQSVVIQHYEIPADANPRRQAKLPPARPTPTGALFNGSKVVRVVKILSVTVSAVNDRVAQTNHGGPPIPFAHAPVLWIAYAFRKCLSE